MNQALDKKVIQDLMRIKGEARGVVFKTDAEFILRRKGKDGLKKIEEELRNLGYPIEYGKLNTMDFYPIGLRILSLLVIKTVFNLDEEKIKEMGSLAPKTSLIIKFFMQHFLSLRKTLNEVSKMWQKHYTVGELVSQELNEKKKYVILRLKNVNLHPLFCCYLNGYFSEVMKMVVGASATAQETKCYFRGDEYHEYLFKW